MPEIYIDPIMSDPINVLVIDDDSEFYKPRLSRIKEFKVDFAIDGRETIEKVKSEVYHVAFLDINLDGENGVDLIEFLQQHRIAIALFTSDINTPSTEKAARLWVEHKLSKPFLIDEFIDTVYKIVDPQFLPQDSKPPINTDEFSDRSTATRLIYKLDETRKSVGSRSSGFSYTYLTLRVYREEDNKLISTRSVLNPRITLNHFSSLQHLNPLDKFERVLEWTKPEFREMKEYRLALVDWMLRAGHLTPQESDKILLKENPTKMNRKNKQISPTSILRIGEA